MFWGRNKEQICIFIIKAVKIEHILWKIDTKSVSHCKHFNIF